MFFTKKPIGYLTTVIPLLLLASQLQAQISQPARYEREHKNNDHEFIIISMGVQGLALIRDTEKYENGKKNWEAVFLDSTLHETWATKIEVLQRMNILGHEYRQGHVYLIFQEADNVGRSLEITDFNVAEKTYAQHLFKPEVNIQFTQFSVLKTKAIFGGYIGKEPGLMMYDLSDETAKIIPGAFQPNVDLIDVRVNINETFNTLLVEGRAHKEKKLVVRTFDSNGVMLVDDVIPIEEGKTIIEAVSSSLMRDEMAIIGTWTYGSNKQAAGIFSVIVDPFKDQAVNYYDFAMLNHFLDYLKPKRVAKIKAKADWRRSVGKPPEFRSFLASVKIEETSEGFSFLSEGYEASTYNYRNSYPYGYSPYYGPYSYYPAAFSPFPYRYYSPYYPTTPYYPSPPSTEVKMTNTSVVFFDGQGKMVSDHSLSYPQIRLNSKDQVSDFLTYHGQTILVCKNVEDIIYKVCEKDGTPVKEEKIKPELKNPNETIRTENQDDSSIRKWYDRFFYVYGFQTLRDNIKKDTRHVFYINKVKVD